MDGAEYLRVVSLRKGKLKVAEFRLRHDERGLSLFRRADHPGPTEVVAAVRAAGKQGELAVVVFLARELLALGLVLVPTPGGTRVADVDRLHTEARFPTWRAVLLRLRGRQLDVEFNARCSDRLLAIAQVLE
jgi:hypothetical protein